MTFDQLSNHYGGGTYRELAAKIGCAHTRLHYWKKHGIPIARQLAEEKKSGGKLKADLAQTKAKAS